MKVLNTIRRVGDSENKKAELIRFGVTGAIATFIQYGFYYFEYTSCRFFGNQLCIEFFGEFFLIKLFHISYFTNKKESSFIHSQSFDKSWPSDGIGGFI